MANKKVSELPVESDLEGLYVLGVDKNNRSVRVLLECIQSLLSGGMTFGGIATPDTEPAISYQNVFYLATKPGTYPNFGNAQVKAGIAVLSNKSGSWVMTQLMSVESEILKYAYTANNQYRITNIEGLKEFAFISSRSSIIYYYGNSGIISRFAVESPYVYYGQIPDGTTYISLYSKDSSFIYSDLAVGIEFLGLLINLVKESIVPDVKVNVQSFDVNEIPSNIVNLYSWESGYLNSDGLITENPIYATSKFVEVKPGVQYSFKKIRFVAQFDKFQKYIRGSYQDLSNNDSAVIMYDNAAFIRFTYLLAYQYDSVIREYDSPSGNIKSHVKVPFISIPIENICDLNVQYSENLFDKNNLDKGQLIDGGELNEITYYSTTKLIAVTPGASYIFSYIYNVAEYDKNGNFISGTYHEIPGLSTNNIINLQDITCYIKASTYENAYYRASIYKGSIPKPYINGGIRIKNIIPWKSKFDGQKVVCFGDSITASVEEQNLNNWCMFMDDSIGTESINQGYWSGRVAHINNDVVNAFSLYSLVTSIISKNWDAQQIIYDTPGYEQHAKQIDKLKKIDFNLISLVTIALGTNDLASGTPFEIEDNPMSDRSVNGAFRYCISQLLTNYPHLRILIMTPIYRFDPTTGDDYTYQGRSIQDFVNDYLTLGQELRVPVVNMFNDISVNKYNRNYYWGENGGDGLHPNYNMKKVMGNKVAGALISCF